MPNPATEAVDQVVEWRLGSIMEGVVVTDSLPSPICRTEIRKTSVDVDMALRKVELLVWHVDFDVKEMNTLPRPWSKWTPA